MAIITLEEDIELLKESGNILAQTMAQLVDMAREGVSAWQLNIFAEHFIQEHGAVPSFKMYGPKGREYPAALCVSVNDEIVHSLPSEDKLFKQGDVIGLDCGVNFHGLFTDCAVTVAIGNVSDGVSRLLSVTRGALECGVEKACVGNDIADISTAIQNAIPENEFGIVRDLVGHGVGYAVHEDPRIPNFWPWKNGTDRGPRIVEGMVLALEPMVTTGDWHIVTGEDGWSVKTKDGSLAAHFEHTVLVTKDGPVVITK